jgi:hypothetical protein
MENIENNKIRINPDIFRTLLQKIRDARNPEEIRVEVRDTEGTTIVYNNGRIHVVSGNFFTRIDPDSLVRSQRNSLQFVVAEKVQQAVMSVILEALP